MSIKNDGNMIADTLTSPSNLTFIEVMATLGAKGKETFVFNGTLDASMVLFFYDKSAKKYQFVSVTKKGVAKAVTADMKKLATDGFIAQLGELEDISSAQPQLKK